MHIDAFGLITQANGDGGDTCHREGMYAFGVWLNEQVLNITQPKSRSLRTQQIFDLLEIKPGIYVRHPDPSKWYADPSTTSRDQLMGVVAACAATGDRGRLWRLFKAVMRRGGFAQNTKRNWGEVGWKIPDPMFFTFGLFIRAGCLGWFYPLLLIHDLFDLVGTLTQILLPRWDENRRRLVRRCMDDVDDNNTVISVLLAVAILPTPLSWVNRKLYARFRPMNFGCTELGETNRVQGALSWYHREGESGGNPEMAELYRAAIERWL